MEKKKGKPLFCEEVKKRKNEYILCAAIHNPEEKDMAGKPLIYCGFRHANILWQGKQVSRKLQHQGFLTSWGRFVNRKEALQIALKAEQVDETKLGNPRIGLFSEDLYSEAKFPQIDDCIHFDLAQGRNKCVNPKIKVSRCKGICEYFQV